MELKIRVEFVTALRQTGEAHDGTGCQGFTFSTKTGENGQRIVEKIAK